MNAYPMYEISKERIEFLIRYLHTYTGFSKAAFKEAVEVKLGIDLGEEEEVELQKLPVEP